MEPGLLCAVRTRWGVALWAQWVWTGTSVTESDALRLALDPLIAPLDFSFLFFFTTCSKKTTTKPISLCYVPSLQTGSFHLKLFLFGATIWLQASLRCLWTWCRTAAVRRGCSWPLQWCREGTQLGDSTLYSFLQSFSHPFTGIFI